MTPTTSLTRLNYGKLATLLHQLNPILNPTLNTTLSQDDCAFSVDPPVAAVCAHQGRPRTWTY